MKLAIVSDLHLGDPVCALVKPAPGGPRLTQGLYDRLVAGLRAAAGPHGLDYLVLLGDVFDFSIASYAQAYEACRVVLRKLADETVPGSATPLVGEIIYVPGNHDFASWAILMHEANVINRIRDGRPVIDRWSSPGVIDDRASAGAARGVLDLPYVTRKPSGKYGGLYLDALAKTAARPDGILFNVAYPNLYLTDAAGATVLVTHGHYLEGAWATTGEIAKEVAGGDLVLEGGATMGIDDIVSINYPFGELSSAGMGMAGPMTPLVRKLQREVKTHALVVLPRYLDALRAWADKHLSYGWKFWKEYVSDKVLDAVRDELLAAARTGTPARYDAEFMHRPEVQARFERYYYACLIEQQRLARDYSLLLTPPGQVVFGHTHQYIAWSDPKAPHMFIPSTGKVVSLFNTGGWLDRPAGTPLGAGLFTYDTAAGWRSTELAWP